VSRALTTLIVLVGALAIVLNSVASQESSRALPARG
jgi:hypothetical protein